MLGDTIDNPPCMQTLICNINGTLVKDNEDNRACIKELIITQIKNNEQESHVMPMCLSQATIDNNPGINYNLGRIDPIPRSIPPTHSYTPDVYIPDARLPNPDARLPNPDARLPTITIDTARDTNGHCANYGICNNNNTNPGTNVTTVKPKVPQGHPGAFTAVSPPSERKGDSAVIDQSGTVTIPQKPKTTSGPLVK